MHLPGGLGPWQGFLGEFGFCGGLVLAGLLLPWHCLEGVPHLVLVLVTTTVVLTDTPPPSGVLGAFFTGAGVVVLGFAVGTVGLGGLGPGLVVLAGFGWLPVPMDATTAATPLRPHTM